MAKANSSSISARVALKLRDGGPDSVNGIAEALELSRTSVENVLGVLTASADITRTTVAGSGVGRPSRRYELDAPAGYVAGVDVGKASIRVVIADLAGTVIADHAGGGVGTVADGASKLDTVTLQVKAAFQEASLPLDRLRAVGLSLPGIVDEAGSVVTSVVIPEWSGVDVGSRLAVALGAPVVVDNGVRLAAVAEHELGAAQLVDDVLYLSVGNRIAMGLILDGKPRRGRHNAAGDIGRLAVRGVDPETGEIRWAHGTGAAELFQRVRDDEPAAIQELAAFTEELAHSLATLIMAVDPGKVVVGGGLSRAHDEFLVPLGRAVSRRIRLAAEVPIVGARLGDEAAAHGALVHAFAHASERIYGIAGMTVPRITPIA
ncbi:ROK family transcriptional regulator [Leucobacter aridicollis]|uniref:ROK family transcriptional regulator n=1 Tax=Leucobacter aridicollis TaxID=283878 RepID=UPI000E657CB9|nr:ROK family protein [Leucobacter aridicollis]UTX54133.1 ROK family protein [Leucobacter aridicollis]